MSSWEERIGGSRAWRALGDLEERLAALREEGRAPEALRRPTRLAGLLRTRLQALDPDLSSQGLLGAIESQTNQLVGALNQYLNNGDPYLPHLVQAEGNLADEIRRLPESGDDGERVALVDALRKDLAAVRSEVSVWQSAVEKQTREAEDRHEVSLGERAAQLEALRSEFADAAAKVEGLQTTVEAFIETQAQALTALTGSLQDRANGVLEAAMRQHDEASLAREEQYQTALGRMSAAGQSRT